MDVIDALLIQARAYNVDRILLEVWKNPRVQNFIIELNTEGQPTSQLFRKGEDSLGVTLGEYSPFTKQTKVENGQPIDRITLRDTGDFYETFVVQPFLKGFKMNANPIKDDDNLFDDYGENIVGLNEENKRILIEFIYPFYLEAEKKIVPSIS